MVLFDGSKGSHYHWMAQKIFAHLHYYDRINWFGDRGKAEQAETIYK